MPHVAHEVDSGGFVTFANAPFIALSHLCPLDVLRLTLSSIWKAVVVVKEKPNPSGYYERQKIVLVVRPKSVSIK